MLKSGLAILSGVAKKRYGMFCLPRECFVRPPCKHPFFDAAWTGLLDMICLQNSIGGRGRTFLAWSLWRTLSTIVANSLGPYQARQKVGTTVMGIAIIPRPLHTRARVREREREYSCTIASVLIWVMHGSKYRSANTIRSSTWYFGIYRIAE